ncbi:MAG: putative Fe-S cluster assembly protein SufT [Pseudomonadota bacterium]
MYSNDSEPFTMQRDVSAVVIPVGMTVTLRKGSTGYITQGLGGNFTVYVEGSLFRIDGVDADALGKEPVKPPEVPADITEEDFEQIIWRQLKTCYDPEIPVDIVELGLVYRCEVIRTDNDQERRIEIDMTLTAPGCGMGDIIVQDVRQKVAIVPTVTDVAVELVFDPPWNHMMMSEEARLQTGMMY